MATVRFSGELKDEIIKAARGKMQAAIDRVEEARPSHDWGMRIYNNIFGDVIPKLNAMPHEWFKKRESIQVRTAGNITLNMAFSLGTAMPFPYDKVENNMFQVHYDNVIDLKDHEVFEEFYQEVSVYKSKLLAAQNRRDEFVKSVQQVIDSYTTLAPALKAWPALWELIPEATKDRHREVKERVKNEVQLGVDLDKLTAMSAAAKFGV